MARATVHETMMSVLTKLGVKQMKTYSQSIVHTCCNIDPPEH